MKKNIYIQSVSLLALSLSSAFAWQSPKAVDLNLPWSIEWDFGVIDKSTFKVTEQNRAAQLEISYSFQNMDPNSSKNVDEKAKDKFRLVAKGEWDLSGYSWCDFEYQGDGSDFQTGVSLEDAEGRSVVYQIFPLVDKARRTYGFALEGTGQATSGFDFSKVRKIAFDANEAGEHRYTPHEGKYTINGLMFSNKNQEAQIAANLESARLYAGDVIGDALRKRIAECEKTLKSREGSVEKIEAESTGIKHAALFSDGRELDPFVIGTESVLRKLRPELTYFNGSFGAPISIKAALGEYESVQLIVVPKSGGVQGVFASVAGDLISDKGDSISKDAISLRKVGFVRTTPSIFSFYDYVGEVADPLEPNGLLNVEAGRIQPIWVTIHVPRDAKAGRYTTKLRVGGEGIIREVLVTLEVFQFEIPKTSRISRQVVYWLPAIANWYGYGASDQAIDYNRDGFNIPTSLIKEHLAFLLDYPLEIINLGWLFNGDNGTPCWPLRVRDDGTLDFSLFDELMEFCRARGMRGFSMGDFGKSDTRIFDQKYRENVRRIMVPFIAHLREKGYFSDASFKVYDEPDTEAGYKALAEECRFVRELAPDAKTLAAIGQPDPRVKDLLDIWLVRPNNWKESMVEELRAAGKSVSWYWCITPYSKPFPNYFINYPGTDPRLIEWLHFKYECNTFLYWAVDNWQNNIKPKSQPRWPSVEWNPNVFATFNGDGQLVYPWPDGSLISSIRLEALRDGAEDVEYFFLLKEKLDALEKQGGSEDLVKEGRSLLALSPVIEKVYRYNDEPSEMIRLRDRVGTLLNQIITTEKPSSKKPVQAP